MPQHCDPDVLALRALGEPVGDGDDDRHLAECAHCRRELDQLRAVAATGRAIEADDQPVTPPASVWRGISAELGLTTGGTAVPAPAADRARTARRTSRWLAAAAAALLGLLLGVGGTLLATQGSGGPPVMAKAELEPLPSKVGEGSARVVGSGASRELDVDVRGLGPVVGFYEVWLLDADGKKLVSLGLLRGGRGRFVLPAGVDLHVYRVVDISIEPPDGNPAHSGDSVVRGLLGI